MPGGFVGVDILFVISGYLITRMLFEDIATNGLSILGFYNRRIRARDHLERAKQRVSAQTAPIAVAKPCQLQK